VSGTVNALCIVTTGQRFNEHAISNMLTVPDTYSTINIVQRQATVPDTIATTTTVKIRKTNKNKENKQKYNKNTTKIPKVV